MGGSQTSNKEARNIHLDTVTGIEPYQQAFNDQLYTVNHNLSNTLGQIGSAPIFSNKLDPVVQGMLAAGRQQVLAQQSANNAGLASSLGIAGTGDNSALLHVLQGQGNLTAAGAMNSLIPQAYAQQREYDIARNGILNQQFQNKLGAIGQQGNLLSAINQMAGVSAGHRVTDHTIETGKVTKRFL